MILPEQPDDAVIPLLDRLQRWRALARLVLVVEAVWPAVWPALAVIGLFLVLALLDAPGWLPASLHLAALLAFAAALLVALGRAAWRFRLPSRAAADRRLEQQSGLRHRPLAAIADRQAVAGAPALWAAHITRAAAQIQRLRVGWPHPGLAAHDPRAWRALLLLALVASLTIAGEQAPGLLWRAWHPAVVTGPGAPGLQLQAWITPPNFTGLAPIFLKAEGGSLSVPAGSQLTVNLTGSSGQPALQTPTGAQPFKPLDASSFQTDLTLTASGHIGVSANGASLPGWDITVRADAPPEVRFPEPPGALRGRTPATRLPWQVAHSYGVASLQADLRLHDRPGQSAPMVVPIPLPGENLKAAKGVRQQDLIAHPWAGLTVDATLVAKAVSGLVGSSADATFTLPERAFQHPVARALIAVRKMLSLKPDDRAAAIHELDQLSWLREAWQNDPGGFLNLRAIAALLGKPPPGVVDEAQARLWTLALHLEDGAAERTGRELARAEQALKDALAAEQRGEKLDPSALERMARDLQDALKQHLQALADQARRDPDANVFDPNAHRLDARDMQKLAEQLRDAASRDQRPEARQKLAELDKMLQAMRQGKTQRGQKTDRERQRAEQRERGKQQMSVLGDLVKREGELLDHAQSRADAVASQFRRAQNIGRPGYQPPATPDQRHAQELERQAQRQHDAPMQQALRRVLGELMQQQADLTGDVPANLSQADTAMRDALRALSTADDPQASGAQQRAIEALQKGGQQMSQQMAQQFGTPDQDSERGDGDQGEDGQGDEMAGDQDGPGQDGQGQDGQGQDGMGNSYGPGSNRRPGRGMDRRAEQRRDPLGRSLQNGTSGTDEGTDVHVPEEMERARTRAIQDELRRRSADRNRPQPELDYIERLLRQF